MTVSAGPLPQQVTLDIAQGATLHVRFSWIENSVLQSLAGMTAVLSIAKRQGTEPLVVVNTETEGEIVLEPVVDGTPMVGTIDVTIPPAKTALLRRNGRYDLVLFSGDEVVRLYEGPVVVDRAVTRTTS